LIGAGQQAGRTRARGGRAGKGAGADVLVQRVSVRVAEPPHLCRLQAATRELCRSIGLDEGEVFSAVIAVSELAHRKFIEGSRPGAVELAVVRARTGIRLEVRAENAGSGAPAGASLTFPPAAGGHS
jgi:hypothetical protein